MNLRERKKATTTSTMPVFQKEGKMNLRERKKPTTSTIPVFQKEEKMNLRERKKATTTSTMPVFQNEGKMNLRERKKVKMTSTEPMFQREPYPDNPDKARMYKQREISLRAWVPRKIDNFRTIKEGKMKLGEWKKTWMNSIEPVFPREPYPDGPDKVRMYTQDIHRQAWEWARKSNVTKMRDLGYVFAPSEQLLIKYYLERKYLGDCLIYCPIEVVDNLYSCHPRDLADIAEKSGCWYFFTTSRPNEIQPNGKDQGEWTSGGMNIVYDQNQKVGAKQVYEYCEGDHKGKYKMIEYQLDPAPINTVDRPWFEYCEKEGKYKRIQYDDSAPNDVKCPWFLCQLCKDDGSGRDVQH